MDAITISASPVDLNCSCLQQIKIGEKQNSNTFFWFTSILGGACLPVADRRAIATE